MQADAIWRFNDVIQSDALIGLLLWQFHDDTGS